ncbi:DUF6254 family protein [Halalkalibacter sp. APA_J-10(15)]|nr:DUF6254 family protein [Halalkalibacter sp. APA_J-10(15)]MCK0471453.1 DUF6254 family protein [Halalkalibacter sp. APA_J-10(15)]
MTQSKSQKDRQFRKRKNAQNPHGKVPSLEEISKDDEKRS